MEFSKYLCACTLSFHIDIICGDALAAQIHHGSLILTQVSDALQGIMLTVDAADSDEPMRGDSGAGRMIPQPATSAPTAFTPRGIAHADQREIGQLHGSKWLPQTQTMPQHPQPPAATVKSKKKSQRVRFWDEIDVSERDAGDSDTDSGDGLATLTHSRGVGAVADTAPDRNEVVGAPVAALSDAQRTIARMREEIRLLRQKQFEQQFDSRRETSAAGTPGSMTQLQNLQQALNRCARYSAGTNWQCAWYR